MRYIVALRLVIALVFLAEGIAFAKGKQKPKNRRPAAVRKVKAPRKTSQAPSSTQRPVSTISNVSVKLKPGGLYLAPCLLGTQEGILPVWEPQVVGRSEYKVSCVSSVDRKSEMLFSVTCPGSLIENESAAYPLDHEFILRFSCRTK